MDITLSEIRDQVESATAEKRWVTIPNAVRYSDLSRSKLYMILPEIRSVCLREPDKTRGMRLIYLPSLEAYLNKFKGAKSEPVPGPKGRRKKAKMT